METVQFIYKEQPVDFQPTGKDSVMVNATQMAKVFGKKINHFMENDNTQEFIKACLRRAENVKLSANQNENKAGIPALSSDLNNHNSGFFGIEKEEDIVISSKKSGTWMHRILALKFAAWLDPDFEVWVFETIDRLINQHFRDIREAMVETLTAEAKRDALRDELIAENPRLIELYALEEEVKGATKKRISAVREQLKQLRMVFGPNTKEEES